MSKDFQSRLKDLSNIDIPRDRLKYLIDEKRDGKDLTHIIDEMNLTTNKKIQTKSAFEGLDDELETALLESWHHMISDKDEKKEVRISATGFDPEGFSGRRVSDTSIVFKELVKRAKRKIVIIGYRFNDSESDFIDLLYERMKKDSIIVQILIDHLSERIDDGRHDFLLDWLDDDSLNVNIWSYEHPGDNELMHIKSILIDDHTAYMGSANFSYGGVRKNIELGVVLADPGTTETLQSIFRYMTSGNIKHVEKMSFSRLVYGGWREDG